MFLKKVQTEYGACHGCYYQKGENCSHKDWSEIKDSIDPDKLYIKLGCRDEHNVEIDYILIHSLNETLKHL